ncbi:MAG TPA: hypothetical protein VGB23_05425 [Nitrospirota bacterium]
MADMGWFTQLVIVGVVFAADHGMGAGVVGFGLAGLYFLAAMYSLFQKDTKMFKKRIRVMVLFLIEIIAVAGYRDNPPDLGFFDRWTQKLAK